MVTWSLASALRRGMSAVYRGGVWQGDAGTYGCGTRLAMWEMPIEQRERCSGKALVHERS